MCGLHEIEKRVQLKQAFEKEKVELMIQELEGMFNNVEELRSRIEEFERKYAELMVSPEYRQKVRALKEELGLAEPLTRGERVSPTLFEKLSGRGKFYNQLAVEILETAGNKAKDTGGVLTLAEVILVVIKERAGQFVEPGDIVKALELLQDCEMIPGIRELSSGVRIVEFQPVEIGEDSNTILDLVAGKGWVTVEEVMVKTRWPKERVERTLKGMEKLGLAQMDVDYAKGTRYYFRGLMQNSHEKK